MKASKRAKHSDSDSDTRERAHDARQRFLARIVRTREKATEKPGTLFLEPKGRVVILLPGLLSLASWTLPS